ncbi:hypothetical protein PUR61_38590 [Streptomyces sp. BE20]|uniref:hypothetical protein n=1 Tax=Streptomyces sp. BE20 TaxID=3002525 RepID=UPI002E7A4B98|nr:hypothetical protein [Streptomyces sp. BE20]MEE1828045.1 hypothetical protein [Streptomyces sp. BE20]
MTGHRHPSLTAETTRIATQVVATFEDLHHHALPWGMLPPSTHCIGLPDPSALTDLGVDRDDHAISVHALDVPPLDGDDLPTYLLTYAQALRETLRATPPGGSGPLDALEGLTVGLLTTAERFKIDGTGSVRQRTTTAVLANGTAVHIVRTQDQPHVSRAIGHITVPGPRMAHALWLLGHALDIFPATAPPPTAHP